MIKLEKVLQQEMTRKQFVLATVSAFASMVGISAFLGAFTKSTDTSASANPGYGQKGYGP